MTPLRYLVFVLCLLAGVASAACPKCDEGLIGSGPVKAVCPWCEGDTKEKDGSFPDIKPDTPKQVSTVPHVGFQDPAPSKAGALDHRQGIARVDTPDGVGSGVLVAKKGNRGIVLTAWHVIRGARNKVTVAFPGGDKVRAVVIASDEAWDVAALLIENAQAEPVPLAKVAPSIGERLTLAGYGLGDYAETSGKVTMFASPNSETPEEMVECAAVARSGDSGGPILTDRGEVAGIICGEAGGLSVGSHAVRLRKFLGGVKWPPVGSPCANGMCHKP